MSTNHTRFTLHEDWTVVVLGFLIILLAAFGIAAPAPSFGWSTSLDFFQTVLSPSNWQAISIQFVFVLIIAGLGAIFTGKPILNLLTSFVVVYVLTLIALTLAGNKQVKDLNLEAVIFSLALGLLIGNVFKLPEWFRKSLSTELFVKIGLILLGTSIIFSDILKAGSQGLL